jgi:glutaredoxin
MLKSYLGEKSVEYEEKLVDQDDEARDNMIEESGGFMGVPFTVVSKDDGSKETVIGFDKNKLNEILAISQE